MATKSTSRSAAGAAGTGETATPPAGAAAAAPTPKRAAAATKTKAPAKAAKPAAAKDEKPKKLKLVRDSFTIPETEYALFAAIKKRCVAQGSEAKKSGILRAALAAFAAQGDAAIVKAIAALAPIRTGRPPKGEK